MNNLSTRQKKSTEHTVLGVEHVDNNKVIVNMEVRDLDGIHNNVETGIDIPGAKLKRRASVKRCPLCGSEAGVIEYKGGYFIKCLCCECMVAKQISVITETIIPFDTFDDAVKKWNDRRGIDTSTKWKRNSVDTADMILERRENRIDSIADVIRRGQGEVVHVAEIIEETGMCRSTVENNVRLAKQKYPQIQSRTGHKGYFWEEIENE